MLRHARARAAIDVDFALDVDVLQLERVATVGGAVVQLVALLGVPLKLEDVLELHLARLAVVEDDHDLPVLLLLLQRLLLVHQQVLL